MNSIEKQYLRLKCIEIAISLDYKDPLLMSRAEALYKYVMYGELN